mmetsp:Transcript_37331/g.88237  ORF Transcript_37331/g.88237 Transcript_37331/m.88237 type:complete len:207 (+) Transcript_37331:2155-2775(+)
MHTLRVSCVLRMFWSSMGAPSEERMTIAQGVVNPHWKMCSHSSEPPSMSFHCGNQSQSMAQYDTNEMPLAQSTSELRKRFFGETWKSVLERSKATQIPNTASAMILHSLSSRISITVALGSCGGGPVQVGSFCVCAQARKIEKASPQPARTHKPGWSLKLFATQDLSLSELDVTDSGRSNSVSFFVDMLNCEFEEHSAGHNLMSSD